MEQGASSLALRVVVLGYGPMGLALVKGVLAGAGRATLLGVYPWSSHPKERHAYHEVAEGQLRWFVQHQGIPLLDLGRVNQVSFRASLETLRPDIVLVGSWGEILRPDVLETPGVLFINCHPSMLPRHRGPNPFAAAILAGDEQTGVTFHRMDAGIDTGPILLQETVDIFPTDTGGTLRERCAQAAEAMVPALLELVAMNRLQEKPQGPGATYETLRPEHCWIDWKTPPGEIDRLIRAVHPWLRVFATISGHPVGFRWGERVTLDTPPNYHQSPGVILQGGLRTIRVSTSDPRVALQLSDPYFFRYPQWLTPPLAGWLFRKGRAFRVR